MPFYLRTITVPPLNQIVAVPQIVIVDQTGPAITLGTQEGAVCMVGEFVAGPFSPLEVDSGAAVQGQYSATGAIYPYFAQDATGRQTGGAFGPPAAYNGNGLLQLLGGIFQRLVLVRVDHEARTTQNGTTRGQLTLTITVATADQTAGVTNKTIVIPAGARFGDQATFGACTGVYAVSGNITIPAGQAVTSNAFTIGVNCFPVLVVEPVAATASSTIVHVLDPALPNVAAGTTISGVTNATALWPAGTGTTLHACIESQYPAAINTTMPNQEPSSDVVVIWSARRVSSIRQALATNAINASTVGRGRIAIVSAEPAASTSQSDALAGITAAEGLASSDNYVQPADRVIICFPQAQVLVPDFGGIAVSINSDSFMATTLANFPEEMNPGASNAFIQTINAFEPAYVANPLQKQDYINLIAAGVCALYLDRTAGWQWMQGVTAANPVSFPTRVPIKRRRMADLIEDNIAQIAAPFLKQPATTERIDAFVAEVRAFLNSLLSPDQPSSQRIVAFSLDDVSGNTAANLALGIFVLIVNVQTLASMDDIIIQANIGETVQVTQPVSAAG